jgi:nucleoside-diphosphate-sugar epimerase
LHSGWRNDLMHIVITGGTGYIGRRVVQMALQQGRRVTMLGHPTGKERAIPWRLGDAVPDAAWSPPADAVIHLAHVWHRSGPEDDDVNIGGTAALLAAACRAGVPRFVFASSLSARADALNRYGRVKYRIENLLDREGEIGARIGLVYGGPRTSLWGTLARIAALPILPMIGSRQAVQPIHLDDVADALLRIASLREPIARRIVLAGEPIAFGDFLREVALRLYGRRPILVPLPLSPFRLLLDGLGKLGLPIQAMRERMLGLAGLEVQRGADDAARLGLSLRPLTAGLAGEAGRPRSLRAAEAAAYLRYVLGHAAGMPTLRRYLRGWRRYDFGAPIAPSLLRACPWLLRFAEPLPWDRRPRAQAVRVRLHAAAALAETDPSARFYAMAPRTMLGSSLRLIAVGTSEAVLLLPRAVIGYWLWR